MKEKKQRSKYTASFKSQVALEALDENVTLSPIGERYGISPGLVGQWKKSLVENSHRLFADSHPEKDDLDRKIEALNREVDALTADYEFLKNSLSAYLKKNMR